MSLRIEKLNDLIRDNLAEIFQKKLSFKRGIFVSVSKVETSANLSESKVFLSVFPSESRQYAMKTVEKELYKIQKYSNQKLRIRKFPRLKFVAENKLEKVSEIEKIFQQIKEEKRDD